MTQDEFDDLMHRLLDVTEHMDNAVAELRLINGRLETRLEQHDQILERHDSTLNKMEGTLNKMEGTLARLDTTLATQTETLHALRNRL